MREFGTIHVDFWTRNGHLSDSAKLLAAYYLTGPHSNSIGIFRCPVGYITADLNWTDEKTNETINELFRNRFITVDKGSDWVVVNNYLKFNKPRNPNNRRGNARLLQIIPENIPKPSIYKAIRTVCKRFTNCFETVPERFSTTDTDTDTDMDTDTEKEEEKRDMQPVSPAAPPEVKGNGKYHPESFPDGTAPPNLKGLPKTFQGMIDRFAGMGFKNPEATARQFCLKYAATGWKHDRCKPGEWDWFFVSASWHDYEGQPQSRGKRPAAMDTEDFSKKDYGPLGGGLTAEEYLRRKADAAKTDQ